MEIKLRKMFENNLKTHNCLKFIQAFDVLTASMWELLAEDAVEWVKTAKEYNENFERCSVYIPSVAGIVDVKNPLGKYPIEGLVGRPLVEMYNSKGERIITKVKCRDYE